MKNSYQKHTKLFTLIILVVLHLSVNAADKAIVVFDASGSMWGQVDGQSKINIAKKTLGNLVNNWDANKELGLLAYGHRRKGDCKDIEALVPVGKLDKAAMIAQVNSINPKGKTPISASIRQAADELKFTEDNATVILISDGKETCNADPCKTATELEKLGVNFTAHVIGFDVDKETSKQLKCIADNTGGKYFSADNAQELNDALQKVVAQPKMLTIKVIVEDNADTLAQIIKWKLINQDSEEVITFTSPGNGKDIIIKGKEPSDTSNQNEISITAGKWLVNGTSDLYSGESNVEITGDENQLVKVSMSKQLPKVTINAPDEATTGTEILVTWDVPSDVMKARIVLQVSDEKPKFYSTPLIHTETKKEAYMRLPSVEGDYVLRFYRNADRKTILAERKIILKPAEITITAPDEAGTGTEIDISWLAPKDAEARLTLQMADEKPKFYSNPVIQTKDKKQSSMRLPAEAGDYVLRWFNNSDQKLVVERPIKIVKEAITINAPDQAGTGTELEISWDAPKTSQARLSLQLADEKPKFYSSPVIHTKEKKQGIMRLPSEAGDYVLRWFNISDKKLVVERPIKLVEEKITINAPSEAGAGTEIDISWIAPKTSNAKINLELADEKPKFYSNPTIHTKDKKESILRLPSVAGDYALRWYNISDKKMISEHPISITEQSITIHAPDEALAGAEIEISWDAPKGLDSFINMQLADEKPKYNTTPYLYTKNEKSGYLRLPSVPGDYTLRWYNKADRKTVVAKRPIKLTAPEITINAADEAIAGTEVEVSWLAPKGLNAFINIQAADEKPSYNAKHYIETTKKDSDYLRLPSVAGDYKLRWYNQGHKKMIVERVIKLVAPVITLNTADEAIAGSEIELFWKAPKNLDSFINIQKVDEKPNYSAKYYTYTESKSSGYMQTPKEPGDYVLRWYNRSDKKIVLEKKIKLINKQE